MRIDEEKTQARLRNVPLNERAHVYDAGIIIEFLQKHIINPKTFLGEILPGEKIKQRDFKNIEDVAGLAVSKGTLYDIYRTWRAQVNYTKKVETLWVFGLILSRLSFQRNGWQFMSFRKGRDQIVYFTPMKARLTAKEEEIIASPIKVPPADVTIEPTPADYNEPEDIPIINEQ